MRPALLFVTAAVLAGTLVGCNSNGEDTQAPTSPRPVVTILVKPLENQTIGFAGTIQPRFQTDRGFRVLGRLISRNVEVGDVVSRGQILAQIDPQLLDLAVRASEADLAKAQAALANTSAAESRINTLLAKRVANQADFDTAQQSREAAAATVKQAQASLAKAREQRSYAILTADEAGVVTSVDAQIGQTVIAGNKVMTIARTDIREAVVDVPDETARSLKQGQSFTIQLQADSSVTTSGKLREIAPQADPSTRTRRVKITLDQTVDAFRLGTTITVFSKRQTTTQQEFEIPSSAVLDRSGVTVIWLLDTQNKTVRTVPVTVTGRDKTKVQVAGQPLANARIVTAGVNSLSEGQKVEFDERISP
ncbi:efflux RND transporter periplasmic adaptor subunit [Labrys portucalensis]|uniref:Efflux RND transporter periplasmic adaptor subunit n=1 Tax=Labrys neptuniae TaxID=376174 RepID=A0ABV6ZRF3_9HYPH